MKYMGSKRWMLGNGLGAVLQNEITGRKRFVDMFSGSGAVSIFMASTQRSPCISYDIQMFSSYLAGGIICRDYPLDQMEIWDHWISDANRLFRRIARKTHLISKEHFDKNFVEESRRWCSSLDRCIFPITHSYGGHYFSPKQAVWFDVLRRCVPSSVTHQTAAISSLIHAGSRCAASPGHTAQPFQPTESAIKFIWEAWNKDVLFHTRAALASICAQFALSPGRAIIEDANKAAHSLDEDDLVFIDPPYSGVHYSRFYHVLETIAKGFCSEVTGVGRYPNSSERPLSKYSIGTQAPIALAEILRILSEKGVTVVLTFPSHQCSNGLSGSIVREIAGQFFKLKEKVVESRFSTLGGNGRSSITGNIRSARKSAQELIFILQPQPSLMS